METTAAHRADHQVELVSNDPLGNFKPRWSTNDELLVWTVSRLDGGRRHGNERDCHVVYALSRGFFVEQTRKFRASAEQCIEMLQHGRRAGTTQRKIPLDTIISVKFSEHNERLHIHTINGTHHLESVSNEETTVLRELVGEITLRMPPGGAEFSDLDAGTINRSSQSFSEAEDRRALAALENAQDEDIADGYDAPSYDLDPSVPIAQPVEMVQDLADAGLDPYPSVSGTDLEQIAAAVHAEMGPESDSANDLPAGITVAGGVEITFDPAPVPNQPEQNYVAPQSVQHHSAPQAESVAPSAAIEIPGEELFERQADGVDSGDGMPESFDRRQHRAMRRRMEEGVSSESVDAGPTESLFPSPAPVVDSYEPGIQLSSPDTAPLDTAPLDTAPLDVAPINAGADYTPAEVASIGQSELETRERRQNQDPDFPSIFDRRGGRSDTEVAGWVTESAESDTAIPTDDALVEDAEHSEDTEHAEPAGPPVLTMPEGSAVGSGGAVGFNPDFDVNPFR